MARGRDDFADQFVDEKISISEYALSASVACGKVRRDAFVLRPLSNTLVVLLRSRGALGRRLDAAGLGEGRRRKTATSAPPFFPVPSYTRGVQPSCAPFSSSTLVL